MNDIILLQSLKDDKFENNINFKVFFHRIFKLVRV